MKFKVISCMAIALAINFSGEAQSREGNFYIRDWRQFPYRVEQITKGIMQPKRLMQRSAENSKEQDIIGEANNIVRDEPVLALILIDENDRILFEKYDDGASAESIIKGNSMTKSAVSVAVGQALCSGVLKSLEDKSGSYSKDLRGTAYGDATLRQLLMMASSGTRAVSAGMPSSGIAKELVTGKRAIRDSFKEFGINQQNPSVQGIFSYKGLDTDALSVAIEDAVKQKFQMYFSKVVWQKIGAERDALIQVDKNGDAVVNSGMGATARDWARLAIYIRNMSAEPSCMGQYIRSATSPQISNLSDTGNLFSSYGYQFWTGNKMIQTKSAWFDGFDGQRIGIDLASGKIIVLLSSELGAVKRVYTLFDRWTR